MQLPAASQPIEGTAERLGVLNQPQEPTNKRKSPQTGEVLQLRHADYHTLIIASPRRACHIAISKNKRFTPS